MTGFETLKRFERAFLIAGSGKLAWVSVYVKTPFNPQACYRMTWVHTILRPYNFSNLEHATVDMNQDLIF